MPSISDHQPAPGTPAQRFQVTSQSADAAIVFFPWVHEDDQEATESDYLDTRQVTAHTEILSLSTSKPKGGMGSWEAVLASNRNWCSVLHASCWCLVYMSDSAMPSSGPVGLKMVGIVKSVREMESVDGKGARTVRYKVSGVDFHDVLNNPVYINPAVLAQNSQEASLDYLGDFWQNLTGFNPGQIVEGLFELMVGQPLVTLADGSKAASPLQTRIPTPRKVPPALTSRFLGTATHGGDFTAFMVRNIQPSLMGSFFGAPLVTNGSTFWSAVEAYSHRVVNECYTDLLHAKNPQGNVSLIPTMVLRSMPFSSKSGSPDPTCIGYHDYARQPTISTFSPKGVTVASKSSDTYYLSRSIRDGEILALDKGKGDAERFNMILCTPNLTMDYAHDKTTVLYALFVNGAGLYPFSVRRNGLRMYLNASIYLLGPKSSDFIDPLNAVVRDIWSKAHLYENGSVTIPGKKGHIPVGTAIEFADRGLVGHVEGVSNAFAVTNPEKGEREFRTTISFSRLQAIGSVPAPVDQTGKSSTSGKQGKWDRGVGLVRL